MWLLHFAGSAERNSCLVLILIFVIFIMPSLTFTVYILCRIDMCCMYTVMHVSGQLYLS